MNRMRGDDGGKGGGSGDPAFGKGRAKFFERPFHAHPGGVFLEAEFGADLGELPVFKIAKQDGFAVGGFEFVHGVVEGGADFSQSASGAVSLAGSRINFSSRSRRRVSPRTALAAAKWALV